MKTSVLLGVILYLSGCQHVSHSHRPVILMGPDEGDVIWFFNESPDELGSGGELRIYIDPETHPEAKASFAKYTMGVGSALPVHRHKKTEEFAYILSGQGAAIVLDDAGHEREIPIAAGTVWYNPPGAWHAVRNTGDTHLVMVFLTVPNEKNGLLSFFRKIGAEPGQTSIQIPPDELERLGLDHDLIFHTPNDDER